MCTRTDTTTLCCARIAGVRPRTRPPTCCRIYVRAWPCWMSVADRAPSRPTWPPKWHPDESSLRRSPNRHCDWPWSRPRARPENIDFVVADVLALDLSDDLFDIVHAHQVLQHVADPIRALVEMRRVCRPGGIVAARDSDYAAFTWFPSVPALDDWLALYRRAARANGGEPDAGRRLQSWARAAGFTDVTATASTWCFATPADRHWWGGMWADRILHSDLAEQAVGSGLATADHLRHIAEGWREWAVAADGWFAVLHGEIICRA